MASQPATPKTPSVRLTDAAPESDGPVSSGFEGHLHCSCLADLVQLECLSGARTVFCVMSEGRQGHLFFEGGRVVHAVAGHLSQEEAAFEMLSWDNGSFVQREVEWPHGPVMAATWQQLLMSSAHRRDEARRSEVDLPTDTAKRVVGLPSLRSSAPPKPPIPVVRAVAGHGSAPPGQSSSAGHSSPPAGHSGAVPVPGAHHAAGVPTFPVVAVSNKARDSSHPPGSYPPSSYPPSSSQTTVRGAVQLGVNGEVLAARGEGQRVLALGAYVRRLCDLIGRDLGLGSVREFSAQFEERRLALFVDENAICVAVETAAEQELDSARGIFQEGARADG
jgi:Domain of unknown function (DUF4388)